MTTDTTALDAELAEKLFGMPPELVAALALGPYAYSTSYEGMGLVLEAMTDRGYSMGLHEFADRHAADVFRGTIIVAEDYLADSLPAAVALAAKAALEAE